MDTWYLIESREGRSKLVCVDASGNVTSGRWDNHFPDQPAYKTEDNIEGYLSFNSLPIYEHFGFLVTKLGTMSDFDDHQTQLEIHQAPTFYIPHGTVSIESLSDNMTSGIVLNNSPDLGDFFSNFILVCAFLSVSAIIYLTIVQFVV